jgi:hypothetical protein
MNKVYGGSGHSTEKVVLVLMNDMLLYGEKSSKLSKGKCKAAMQLPGMCIEDFSLNQAAAKIYTDLDITKCFRIKTRSHKPLIFQCNDIISKNQWMDILQQTIDQYARTMKRSVAPDQLQLACYSADDFERTILRKKVDKRSAINALQMAQTIAASNKANPLPPSPTNSPKQENRRIGSNIHSNNSIPQTSEESHLTNEQQEQYNNNNNSNQYQQQHSYTSESTLNTEPDIDLDSFSSFVPPPAPPLSSPISSFSSPPMAHDQSPPMAPPLSSIPMAPQINVPMAPPFNYGGKLLLYFFIIHNHTVW